MLIVFCVVISWLSVTGVLGVTDIKVGVMLIRDNSTPYSLERVDPAIQVAIDVVNSEILNNTYRLVPILRAYDDQCSARNGTGFGSQLYFREHISAMIGPACSLALEGVARLAGYWNIPIITGMGDSGVFAESDDYPTLTRFAYCQCHVRRVLSAILKKYNWSEITVLVDISHPQNLILGNSLRDGLQKEDIRPNVIDYNSYANEPKEKTVEYIRSHSRIIIFAVSGDTLREFLLTFYDMGYISTGEYVFFDLLPFPFPGDYWGNHDWRRGDSRDSDAMKAYEALLRISLFEPISEDWTNFTQLVIKKANETYGFDFRGEKVNFFIGAFYDAVIRYGYMVKEGLELGISYRDGYKVSKPAWNRTYTGVTGEYRINEAGDRETNFAILDMDPVTGEFQAVAHFTGKGSDGYVPYLGRTIHWAGGRLEAPPNVPVCGYLGNLSICENNDLPLFAKILLSLSALAIVGITAGIIFYRRRKWERELTDMSWRIKLCDLNFQSQAMGSRMSRLSCGWLNDDQMSKSASSFATQAVATELQGVGHTFANIAVYRGVAVVVKPIDQEKVLLSREILLELKLMQQVHHENMSQFIGAVIEPKNNFVVTEYCSKGSLQDILQNDSVKLDWMFKLSLLRDIARGMTFLHQSPIKVHGRLRSTNCLVDRKFVLKISGYGLQTLTKRTPTKEEVTTHAYYEKLLWVAPELLQAPLHAPTQKCDVYSFGIILEEVIHRALPYDKLRTELGPKEIVGLVGSHLDPPFRPKLDAYQGNVPLGVYSLMYRCWSETPEDRPTFAMIGKTISKLQGNKEVNLVEALIRRLEEYSSNLEDTVEERTQQLLTEKKKSEALLYQIIPVSVANQLKQGKQVEPEMFDRVTVYFSDIVGFTKMSSESTPVEVVEFLNDLYTLFDSVIGHYDVYKVETIGDAYMCVSGLPIKNDNHAVEICRMALALLQGVKQFKIRHRPDDQLRVRIGVHSGPCAAGVVGLKMPRYCLFGDTVNTSSRMESTGEALKIHVSEMTRSLLGEKFNTELRGKVDMKGKGEQLTYWLIGERTTNS